MKRNQWKKRFFALCMAVALALPQSAVVLAEEPLVLEQSGPVLTNGETEQPEEGDSKEEEPKEEPKEEGEAGQEEPEQTEQEKEDETGQEGEDPEGPLPMTPVEEATEREEAKEKQLLAAPRGETVLSVSPSAPDEAQGVYASLQEAVGAVAAGEEATILVEESLTLTEVVRLTGQQITLASADPQNPVTICRGEDFATIQDNARSTYNPAMFEVTVSGGADSLLRVENIILDDEGKYEGDVFAQAISGAAAEGQTKENHRMVQDAMIAAYGTGTYKAEVVLGEGAVLKNFGGMSAVRVTENASLTMESGSLICDEVDVITDRARLHKDSKASDPYFETETGPAGAVWVQGYDFVMEDGAEIRDVLGRAVYMDGGTAWLNGQIYDLRQDPDTGSNGTEKRIKDMWQGNNGLAGHIRNNAEMVLGNTFLLDNSNTDIKMDGAFYDCSGYLEMQQGAVIRNLVGTAIRGHAGTGIEIVVDGEICGILEGGNAINLNESDDLLCTIGPNAYIHDNTVWYGAVYIQGKGIHVDLYGRIENNYSTDKSGGMVLANNFSGHSATMYDGATIKNNVSKNDGAGMVVSCGTFVMEGGEISGNVATGAVENGIGGGVYVRRGGTFIMEDGSITDNVSKGAGGGIYYTAENYGTPSIPARIQLLGGTIARNLMQADVTLEADNTASVTGGVENDITIGGSSYSYLDRALAIGDDVALGEEEVYLEKYDITMENPAGEVRFGNASAEVIQGGLGESTAKGWSDTELASFWFASEKPVNTFALSLPAGLNPDLPVYAIVLATNEEGGLYADGGSVTCFGVEKTENQLLVTTQFMDGNHNSSGYGVVLVQPTVDYGTMTITAPETIEGTKDDNGYEIDYTATYVITENLLHQVTSGVSGEDVKVSFLLKTDPDLTVAQNEAGQPLVEVESQLFVVESMTQYANGIVVICTGNPEATDASDRTTTIRWTGVGTGFDVGKVLTTSGQFETVEGWNVFALVPSNVVQTTLEEKESGGETTGGGSSGGGSGRIVTHYVVYHDGEEEVREGKFYHGQKIEAAENPFTAPKGFVFAGWSKEEGGEVDFLPGEKITMPDETYHLYAVWAEGEAYHAPYLNGYPDGTIRPEQTITRAETAMLFYQLMGTPENQAGTGFTDVAEDSWYGAAVRTLAGAGILNGYPDQTFRPDAAITRAEFVTMATGFMGEEKGTGTSFLDVAEGAWYAGFVATATENGWISGYPDGSFRPEMAITRAEAVSILNRMMDRSADMDFILANEGALQTFGDLSKNHWAYGFLMEAANGHTYLRQEDGSEIWQES